MATSNDLTQARAVKPNVERTQEQQPTSPTAKKYKKKKKKKSKKKQAKNAPAQSLTPEVRTTEITSDQMISANPNNTGKMGKASETRGKSQEALREKRPAASKKTEQQPNSNASKAKKAIEPLAMATEQQAKRGKSAASRSAQSGTDSFVAWLKTKNAMKTQAGKKEKLAEERDSSHAGRDRALADELAVQKNSDLECQIIRKGECFGIISSSCWAMARIFECLARFTVEQSIL